MTFAWYAHLKDINGKAWYVAALLSWGIALFEYLLQVPGNRIGYARNGSEFGKRAAVRFIPLLHLLFAKNNADRDSLLVKTNVARKNADGDAEICGFLVDSGALVDNDLKRAAGLIGWGSKPHKVSRS